MRTTGVCYVRAEQTAKVPENTLAPFFTNTKPERFIDNDEIAEIKQLFIDTIDKLQEDVETKIFGNYTPSPNILSVYGFEIKGIDDALEFLLYHEGYHTGFILAFKKIVG